MRKPITVIAVGGFVALALLGISTAHAQTLKRPVDAPTEPEVSLAELAKQINPSASASIGARRVFTNADLKLRPAPVAPITPPFPEIAPPTFILENWSEPDVPAIKPEPEPTQYGVPIWDYGYGPWGFTSPGWSGKGPRRPGFFNLRGPAPFQPFQRPDMVMFSANGDFSRPSTPSSRVMGTRFGQGRPSGRQGGSHGSSGQPSAGGRGGSHGSRGR
jgi:hypothetical protein